MQIAQTLKEALAVYVMLGLQEMAKPVKVWTSNPVYSCVLSDLAFERKWGLSNLSACRMKI